MMLLKVSNNIKRMMSGRGAEVFRLINMRVILVGCPTRVDGEVVILSIDSGVMRLLVRYTFVVISAAISCGCPCCHQEEDEC